MDNIILDKWIDAKKGIKVRIQRKSSKDNTSILILDIDENGNSRQKVLFVYENISEGAWTGSDTYGVVHRVAGDGRT